MAGTSVFNAADAPVLYRSALADFSHDFSDPGRSDVTQHTLNGIPIEYAKTPNRNYRALNTMIDAAKAAAVAAGKGAGTPAQAYWIFRNEFQLTVPLPGGGVPDVNAPPSEPDVVAAAGIPYDDIMAQLTRDAAGRAWTTGRPPVPIERGPVALGFNTTHNYSIRSLPAKAEGTLYAIPTVLRTLIAEGQRTFVLMWDAGNISITRLHEELRGATGGPYTFYFIRSKENISDPAPKITAESMRSSPNVRVYFLEDNYDHVSTYPIYADGSTNNENLFSAFTLETKLNEDGETVSGTIKVGGTAMSVKDIGKQSEVKQAVVTAVHMKLNEELPETIMPYFFLKRAGDWCQALCLLDRNRPYRVIPTAGAPVHENQVTVDELEGEGAYVAMITIDRIMLAYLVGAGLNVFYTTVRPGATWITSFRNTDAGRVDDRDALTAAYPDLEAKAAAIKHIYDRVVTGLDNTLNDLPREFGPRDDQFAEDIIWIRKLYVHLATLPPPAQVDDALRAATEARGAIDDEGANVAFELAKLRNAIAAIKTMENTTSVVVPESSGKDAKTEEAFTVVVNKIRSQEAVDRQDAGIIAFYSFIDDIATAFRKVQNNMAEGVSPPELPRISFVPGEGDPVFPRTRSQPEGLTAGSLLVQRWNAQTAALAAPAGGGKRMKGGRRPLQTLDDLYSVYAYEPSNRGDVAVAGLISLKGGTTAALGSSILLPSGFLATVASDFLFEPGVEQVIEAGFADPRRSVYLDILKYDKLRMDVHKLQSAPALDTVAQQRLFDLNNQIYGVATFDDGSLVTLDQYIASVYPDPDSMDADSYEREANVAFLRTLLGMEERIRARVDRYLTDVIRPIHLAAARPAPTEIEKRPIAGLLREYRDTTRVYPYAEIEVGIIGQPILEAAAAAEAAEAIVAIRGARVPPVPNPLKGGDLQPRRSLYTKHVGGSAPAPRRGLYAGLW